MVTRNHIVRSITWQCNLDTLRHLTPTFIDADNPDRQEIFVNLMQDEAECFALTLRFFRALDARDHPACVRTFAPGGVWHRQGRTLATPEDMLAALEQRAADRVTAHLITNLIAQRLGGDRIVVQFLLTAFDGRRTEEGVPTSEGGGVMDGRDEYVRTPEGWRLAEKRAKPLFKFS